MFRKYVQSVCFVLEETNVTMQNAGLANITSENYFFILQILVPQDRIWPNQSCVILKG
jgi:hypothetical protein